MCQHEKTKGEKKKSKIKGIIVDSTDFVVNEEGMELQKDLENGDGADGITTEFKI